jgi:hypothetical protein
MQVLLLLMPVAILRIPTAILWVAVKMINCVISVIAGFGAFVLCAYCCYWIGFGLPGMAGAFLAGQVVYLLVSWGFTLRLIIQERREAARFDDKILVVNPDYC